MKCSTIFLVSAILFETDNINIEISYRLKQPYFKPFADVRIPALGE